ncbi:hypothetical protein AAG570_013154 [Ranatra chinensis]|uniref:CBM21 domain-containing protein n=1 Tax=Ranatra chinensis TaxID=642074 RepID=A0ABD0YFX8_9HEMI
MCSVAGEMLAAYSPPSYYFPCRMGSGSGGGGGAGSGGSGSGSGGSSGSGSGSGSSGGSSASPNTVARRRGPRPQPSRPCIVLTQNENHQARAKKKVVFADDRGLSLTQVRMMTEPSNQPPSWSAQFISALTEEDDSDNGPDPWRMEFSQPASDYIEFKRRLDHESVSLENVFIKDSEAVAIGTVKVRNLAYHKEVTVRATYDGWKSFADFPCSFVDNGLGSNSVTVLYDTFSFRIQLADVPDRVEFCVRYKSDGKVFWDNNGGRNYALVREGPAPDRTGGARSQPRTISSAADGRHNGSIHHPVHHVHQHVESYGPEDSMLASGLDCSMKAALALRKVGGILYSWRPKIFTFSPNRKKSRFSNDEEVKETVEKWLSEVERSVSDEVIKKLVLRLKCIEVC